MFAGGFVSYAPPPGTGSHVAVRIHGRDLLVLEKAAEGWTVSAEVYDENGALIVQINKGAFEINRNNFYRTEHPDPHSLLVINQRNELAVNVRFLNPRAITVTGHFHYARKSAVL